MENLPEEIKIQCSHCHFFVEESVGILQEDNSFSCPHCLSTTVVDVNRFLEGLESLMSKVKEAKGAKHHMKEKVRFSAAH